MSLFAESTWETDAVGDKLVKDFAKKKKKKSKKLSNKKSESASLISAEQYKEACKNVKAVAANIGTSKSAKLKEKKRKRFDSVSTAQIVEQKSKKLKTSIDNVKGTNSSIPAKKSLKKSKKFKNLNDKVEDEIPTKSKKKNKTDEKQLKGSVTPVKKLSLSKIKKSVIAEKSPKKVKGSQQNVEGSSSNLESSNTETKSQRKRRKLKLKKSAAAQQLNDTSGSNIRKKAANESSTKSLNVQRIEKLLALKEKNLNGKTKMVKEPESLRDRMMTQLRASRFRFLNETLYNNESSESKKYFKEDPDAFTAYHSGYRQQVEQWPLNPLDIVISSIKKMSKEFIIADFGCGEARLAESVPQKVHSFDLVAVNDKVKACDMAHTPLLTNGVNVVVFCLSLMGKNLSDYLLEANRVLKKDGILKIAEVESRFESVDEFIQQLENYGFTNTWKDLSHNLFYFMDFKKVAEVNRNSKKLPDISLKSCVYKKR